MAPISSQKKSFKPTVSEAFFLFLFFFLIEIIYFFYSLSNFLVSDIEGFQNISKADFRSFIFTGFKLLLMHLVFFVFNIATIHLFKPKKWIYSIFFILYSTSFIFVFYPYLHQDFFILNPFLKVLSPHAHISLVYIAGGLYIGHLTYFLLQRFTELKLDQFFMRFFFLGLMTYFIFWVNNPLNFYYGSSSYSSDQKQTVLNRNQQNIILIGISGLDPKIFLDQVAAGHYPFTQKYLQQAQVLSDVYTSIARTQVTYEAIFDGDWSPEKSQRHTIQNEKPPIRKNLARLKSMGFKTVLFFSNYLFATFKSDNTLDEVVNESPGMRDHLYPTFVRDRLLFAWFNNSLGEFFFPEIIKNGSMMETFFPHIFLNQNISKINSLENENAPYLFISHFAKLHWPGALQYPYYSVKTEPTTGSFYSYGPQSLVAANTNFSSNDLEFNKKNYKNGIRQLLDSYLEPFFRYLYESKIADSASIALYSDHSESFYKDGIFPYRKMPSHGNQLNFGDTSNKCFLAVKSKFRLNLISENKVLNISHLLDIVLDSIGGTTPAMPYYQDFVLAESDISRFRNSPYQLHSRPGIFSNMRISEKGELESIPQNLPLLTLEKQRGLIANQYKFIIYPHFDGYHYEITPPHFENKLDKALLLEKLKLNFSVDLKNNLLPDLKFNAQDQLIWNFSEKSEPLTKKNQYFNWLYLLTSKYNFFDLKKYFETSKKILKSEVINKNLRTQVVLDILSTCQSVPTHAEFRNNDLIGLIDESLKIVEPSNHFVILSKKLICLLQTHQIEQAIPLYNLLLRKYTQQFKNSKALHNAKNFYLYRYPSVPMLFQKSISDDKSLPLPLKKGTALFRVRDLIRQIVQNADKLPVSKIQILLNEILSYEKKDIKGQLENELLYLIIDYKNPKTKSFIFLRLLKRSELSFAEAFAIYHLMQAELNLDINQILNKDQLVNVMTERLIQYHD